ncbi:MAG: DUF1775 domain-containing protein [Myxococcales bacterium]|nr:DUF1775 domain-containing protein [Myxococcales bacterium]
MAVSFFKLQVAMVPLMIVGVPEISLAHVSVTSGAVEESTETHTSRALVRFGIPHGCQPASEGVSDEPIPSQDTYKVRIVVPEVLATVGIRAVVGPFGGAATFEKEENAVKAIVWERSDEVNASDEYHYDVAIRFTIPQNMKFKSLFFPAFQHCRAPGADTGIVNAWVQHAEHLHGEEEGDDMDTEPEMGGDSLVQEGDDLGGDTVVRVAEAPQLLILPVRKPGWNQFRTGTEQHLHGTELLGKLFADAEIVWFGERAFSVNPATMKLIEDDPEVEVLEEIHNDSDIWVKY